MRVLYVEDNANDANLTRRALARVAPEIDLLLAPTIAAAQVALLEAHRRPPTAARPTPPPAAAAIDLVLTDLRLPDGSGLDLIGIIREARWPVAIVVVTGQGDENAAVAALKAGADDYLIKREGYLERLPSTLYSARQHFLGGAARRNRPLRVLYAEDVTTDFELAQRFLARHAPHMRLDIVHDGQAVLARLPVGQRFSEYNLILADYQLPDMSALELLKEVRQVRGLDIPLLVITGQGDEETAAQALKLGASDYIVKSGEFYLRLPAALENAHLQSELEHERAALRDSEARFRQLAEYIQEVFWLTDADMRTVLYVSPAYEALWGQPCAAMYADPLAWTRLIHPEDRERVLQAAGAKRPLGDYDEEYRIVRVDGSVRHIRDRAFPIRDRAGRVYRIAGIAQDITARKEQEAQIRHLAYHDALTGLPNRALVMNRLEQAMAHAQRHRRSLAVLFLDLDRFKTINDTLGHPAGDRLLKQVAERLGAALREEDTVGRVGGDEFLMIVPDLDEPENAAHVATKALSSMARAFTVSGHELHATGSIGISFFPRDSTNAETLVKYADTALYLAKEQGRNTFRFFSPDLDARVRERLLLENELRRAIDRDQLILHYQPQAELATGRITGVEALVRWRRGSEGLLMPSAFIPVAEETGLIVAMGEWVLRAACRQARAWRQEGLVGVRVSVNISGRQLERQDFAEDVRKALDETGCDPDLIELEVTESSLMASAEGAAATLLTLHRMGVQLAMDDFGTGYSSLAHLKRFPLHRLKIDKSFIRGIPEDENDMAIVQAIIAMARQLRLRVVAEGVETEAQRSFLAAHGCDEMQGYLFSSPKEAARITALLSGQLPGGGPRTPHPAVTDRPDESPDGRSA